MRPQVAVQRIRLPQPGALHPVPPGLAELVDRRDCTVSMMCPRCALTFSRHGSGHEHTNCRHALQLGVCIQFATPFGCSRRASKVRFPGRVRPWPVPSSSVPDSMSSSSAGPSAPSDSSASSSSRISSSCRDLAGRRCAGATGHV
eukprot:scaffold4109_cov133-Isochrysis_galbana.AAC.5